MAKNWNKPTIIVNHRQLERLDNSETKSNCPICNVGVLATCRNTDNDQLLVKDHCYNCGQHFIYADIKLG